MNRTVDDVQDGGGRGGQTRQPGHAGQPRQRRAGAVHLARSASGGDERDSDAVRIRLTPFQPHSPRQAATDAKRSRKRSGTQGHGQLIAFPASGAQAAHQAARLDASRNALASAISIAEHAYGVSVVWEPARQRPNATVAQGASATPIPLVTGDIARRRLTLSREGLNRLTRLSGMKRTSAVLALDAATRFLSAQSCAVLSVAARVAARALSPANLAGATGIALAISAPSGPRSTVEFVVAFLAASGICQIVTLPGLPGLPRTDAAEAMQDGQDDEAGRFQGLEAAGAGQ